MISKSCVIVSTRSIAVGMTGVATRTAEPALDTI